MPDVPTVPPAGTTAPSQEAPPGRVQWADTAKGVCILLVVLWHVIMKHYLRIDWDLSLPIPGAWGELGELLLPLRMPLFFTISGLFAARAVARSWRSAARSRIAKFLYLYALWLLIHTAVFHFTPDYPTDHADNALELLEHLTITPTNLWYLLALAVYFVIAKSTRRLPAWAVLVPALALSVASSAELLDVPGNRGGLYQNLVFFLAGLYFRPVIEKLAATASARRLVVTGAAYAAALGAMAALGADDVPGVWPAVCVVATAFGLTGAVLLSRVRPVATPLAALGRQTLPIYVLHMPLLALIDLALHAPLSASSPGLQLGIAVAEPLLLTALTAWICLQAHRGLRRVGAHALFDLPGGSGARPRRAVKPAAPSAAYPSVDPHLPAAVPLPVPDAAPAPAPAPAADGPAPAADAPKVSP